MRNLSEYGFNTEKRFCVIAEAGINHGGEFKKAEELIISAARSGADAVKFQTYITERRVSRDSPIFGILKRCELPFEAFSKLKECAAANNIAFLSTPFDEESLDCLKTLGCSIYKLASFDVTNLEFLKKAASCAKTLILSTGMADIAEIKTALEIIKTGGSKPVLLHCVSAYPLKEEDADLETINTLRDNFDCVIGYSDHTCGIKVPLYAMACGAQVIEKHFMVDEKCVDAAVSITASQMRELVEETVKLDKIMGRGLPGAREAEKGTVMFRRRS